VLAAGVFAGLALLSKFHGRDAASGGRGLHAGTEVARPLLLSPYRGQRR